MEIIIPLPQYSFATNTYLELKSYLKQLELAVHHAQKSVENAEKDGIKICEDSFISFCHPALSNSLISEAKEKSAETETAKVVLENFEDTYYDELQNIELRINLQ